jgi:hypothetical protein
MPWFFFPLIILINAEKPKVSKMFYLPEKFVCQKQFLFLLPLTGYSEKNFGRLLFGENNTLIIGKLVVGTAKISKNVKILRKFAFF